MPRPIRFFAPGVVWHITHRCHGRAFLFGQAKYRTLWTKWLYMATHRYDVPVLNFTVTSNHVHLLVSAPEDTEAIPRLVQLVAGRVGQAYNKAKRRKGAFWEKRYHATAIQNGEHLARCFLYIDLNMVRAGQVRHPKQWKHCGYQEIVYPKSRYRTLDRAEIARLVGIDPDEIPEVYQGWISEALRKGNLARDSIWSSELAIGDPEFTERIYRFLGRYVGATTAQEEIRPYGENTTDTSWVNALEWDVFEA